MGKPEDLLEKIPKGTPIWAIGVTTVLVAITVSLVTVYIVLRPEVQSMLKNKYEMSLKEAEVEKSAVQTIMNMVKVNVTMLSQQTEMLKNEQHRSNELEKRVKDIENKLEHTDHLLGECRSKLKLCLDK